HGAQNHGDSSSAAYYWHNGGSQAFDSAWRIVLPFLPLFLGGMAVLSLLGLALSVCVKLPLEVGVRRYFLESTQYRFSMGELFYGFTCGGYGNLVGTMLLRAVYNALWYLLLVIPGIVKSYAYSMVPYILAENPHISASRAITLSRDMTRGHRLDMWVLDLSFVGWYLLGTLALGIGVLFVNPYPYATHAELYVTLRSQAIDRGMTSLDELSPPAFGR
ncbi:MAG: DUF975 family protein, partial [Oscillospiraceae bacterium]